MQKLVDAVEKASPLIWHAAYRQVWIECGEAFVGVVLLLCLWVAWARWVKTWIDEEDRKIANILGGAICLIVSLLCAMFIFECLANPTYQAIKNLKGLL